MIQWERFLPSIPQISSFFWSSNTSINSLDRIKKLIKALSRPASQPILRQKITTQLWPFPSLRLEDLLYLFSLKKKISPPPTGPFIQFKNLLRQDSIEKKTFVEHASCVFGQRLITAVQKTIDSLPNLINVKDLWPLFAMIGRKLTTGDLKTLLEKVNSGEIPLPLSRKISNNIQDLPFQDIGTLVDFFSNPPRYLLPEEKKKLWEELKRNNIPLHTGILANTEYELYIHKLAGNVIENQKQLTTEDLKLLPFAISEQLARVVAYASLDCEEIIIPIPVFSEQQDIVYYQLKNHINEKGLCCYLFTPLKGNFPAQLVFKGTDDKESLCRDLLDLKGIGKTVFDECKHKIAKMIEDYCQKTKNPSLGIAGHSLGGSDAQRAALLCLEQLNKENNNGPFSRLLRIDCFTFCSAKLDRVTIKSWEKQIDKCKRHGLSPKISLNFAYHKDDGLTQVGYKNLYIPKDKEFLEFLEENYLQVYSKSGILGTNAHHREPFFKEGRFYTGTDDRKYIYYSSTDFIELNEKINKRLNVSKEFTDKKPKDNILLKKELKVIKSLKQELVKMQENAKEIRSYQEGYSSDSSWIVFFAYKLLIAPGQYLFHWIKEGYPTESYWVNLLVQKLLTSRQSFSHWVKSYWLKV